MKRVVAENLYLKIECSLRQAAEIKQSFGFSRFTPFITVGRRVIFMASDREKILFILISALPSFRIANLNPTGFPAELTSVPRSILSGAA